MKTSKDSTQWREVSGKLIRVALASVPVYGGSILQAVQEWRETIAEKRLGHWMEEVGRRLSDLEELKDKHICWLVEASAGAAVTPNAEKLDYLRNAVSNLILEDASELDAAIFLDLTRKLTASHIRVLLAFENNAPGDSVDMEHLRNLGLDDEMIVHLAISLGGEGLLNHNASRDDLKGYVKPLGKRFVHFLKSPEEE